MTQTRYKDLAIGKIGHDWSFYSTETGSRVGPIYRTKMECFCDLERYAKEAGWTE